MRACGFVLLLLMASCGNANTLRPFTTDGCSLWMDGTMQQPNLWRHCCVAHDLAYWLGGNQAKRKKADEDILDCVMVAQGSGMAKYMYANIRWGGSPYWMNHYRWGYGWNYFDGIWPRGYKEPTAEEQAQIDRLLPAALQLVADDARVNPAKNPPATTGSASSTIPSSPPQ